MAKNRREHFTSTHRGDFKFVEVDDELKKQIDAIRIESKNDELEGTEISESFVDGGNRFILENCGTGAGGFQAGNECAKGGGSGDGTAVAERPAKDGKSASGKSSKDNIQKKHRLPDGFHATWNSLDRRDVDVKPLASVSSDRWTGSESIVAIKSDSEIAKEIGGHDDHLIGQAIADGSSIREVAEAKVAAAEAKGIADKGMYKRWSDMLKSGKIDAWDEKLKSERATREKTLSELSSKGYVIPKTQEEAMSIIGKELTKRLGEPDKSDISPSRYWFTSNGRSIRVSNHAPVYYFEDSGVNIVPNAGLKAGQMTDAVIWSGSTAIHPSRLADEAIKKNRALPPVDVKAAIKRTTREGVRESLEVWEDARFIVPACEDGAPNLIESARARLARRLLGQEYP